jgi:hypothetical protein
MKNSAANVTATYWRILAHPLSSCLPAKLWLGLADRFEVAALLSDAETAETMAEHAQDCREYAAHKERSDRAIASRHEAAATSWRRTPRVYPDVNLDRLANSLALHKDLGL